MSNRYGEMAHSYRHFIATGRATMRSQEIHQRFIIIGEEQSGKSSLGNLLLDQAEFPAKWSSKPAGKSKHFPMGEVDISSNIAYGNKRALYPDQMLKVQVVDQPENSNPKQYGEFWGNCISNFVTYLITINLNSKSFPQHEFTKISDITQMIAITGFNLYSNAMIVFTHKDYKDESSDQSDDSLKQLIGKQREQKEYAFLSKLLKSVQERYIFISAVNFDRTNRNKVIGGIFQTIRNPEQKMTCDDKSKSEEICQNVHDNFTESKVLQNKNTESDDFLEPGIKNLADKDGSRDDLEPKDKNEKYIETAKEVKSVI